MHSSMAICRAEFGAAGVFSPQSGQMLAQLVGIAALLGVFLPAIYLLFKLIETQPQLVSSMLTGEREADRG